MEVEVVTIGTIKHAQLLSYHHYQHTNTQEPGAILDALPTESKQCSYNYVENQLKTDTADTIIQGMTKKYPLQSLANNSSTV